MKIFMHRFFIENLITYRIRKYLYVSRRLHLQHSVHFDLLLDISITTTLKIFLKIVIESSRFICFIYDPFFVYGANKHSHALMPYIGTSKHRLYIVVVKYFPYEGKENHEKNIFGAECYSFISFK
jgi:hypothetical protein